jgi:hypothetical protein
VTPIPLSGNGFTVKATQPRAGCSCLPRAWPQRKAQRQAEREDALAAMAAQREQEEVVPLAVRLPCRQYRSRCGPQEVPRSNHPKVDRREVPHAVRPGNWQYRSRCGQRQR